MLFTFSFFACRADFVGQLGKLRRPERVPRLPAQVAGCRGTLWVRRRLPACPTGLVEAQLPYATSAGRCQAEGHGQRNIAELAGFWSCAATSRRAIQWAPANAWGRRRECASAFA